MSNDPERDRLVKEKNRAEERWARAKDGSLGEKLHWYNLQHIIASIDIYDAAKAKEAG